MIILLDSFSIHRWSKMPAITPDDIHKWMLSNYVSQREVERITGLARKYVTAVLRGTMHDRHRFSTCGENSRLDG